MSKGLSNGVLSLRFMQNAQRAKQQAQVEAEQAKIKDEAEWEVPKAVKDAWGIGSNTPSSSSTVTHEASYLPFLFSSTADSFGESSSQGGSNSPPKLKGRRTFNARGQEVTSEPTRSEIEDVEMEEGETKDDTKSLRGLATISGFQNSSKKEGKQRESHSMNVDRSNAKPQSRSISGFHSPLSAAKPRDNKRVKTAQMLIREDNGRGLRGPPPLQMFDGKTDTVPVSVPPTGFLKPAGVDAPTGLSSVPLTVPKRVRESADPVIKEEKRPKKKKKGLSS